MAFRGLPVGMAAAAAARAAHNLRVQSPLAAQAGLAAVAAAAGLMGPLVNRTVTAEPEGSAEPAVAADSHQEGVLEVMAEPEDLQEVEAEAGKAEPHPPPTRLEPVDRAVLALVTGQPQAGIMAAAEVEVVASAARSLMIRGASSLLLAVRSQATQRRAEAVATAAMGTSIICRTSPAV